MKNFISILDTGKSDLEGIFNLADKSKDEVSEHRGLTAALLFNMPSTRTLVSFEAALNHLGISPSHLDYVFTQMVRGEEMKDTAMALSQYVSIIIARLNDHALLERLVQHASVPVINAGTPLEHPCQALADLYTLREKNLLKPKTKLAIVGDPSSNVVNSMLIGAAAFGISCTLIAPKGYMLAQRYFDRVKKQLTISDDVNAIKDTDVIYVSSWTHETEESAERMRDFLPYQVNARLVQKAPNAIVMHPLPAFRGVEITNDVLDGKQCVAIEQSKNRLYVQKALLKILLGI